MIKDIKNENKLDKQRRKEKFVASMNSIGKILW